MSLFALALNEMVLGRSRGLALERRYDLIVENLKNFRHRPPHFTLCNCSCIWHFLGSRGCDLTGAYVLTWLSSTPPRPMGVCFSCCQHRRKSPEREPLLASQTGSTDSLPEPNSHFQKAIDVLAA